jgi:small GTP-binding protein
MGHLISKVLNSFGGGNRETRVLMLGLDGAGKTTISLKLKLGELVPTPPTIGFSVETIEFKNLRFNIWDIGGQDKIRVLWRHYYPGTDAIIWVADTSDKKRVKLVHYELQKLMEEEDLKDCPLLVFANKMDLAQMSTAELAEKLELSSIRGREWYCQGCSAVTGSGLYEGLNWLSDRIKKAHK